MACNIIEEFKAREKNRIAEAHREYERSRLRYQIEKDRYNEIVLNMNWRDWIYVDYSRFSYDYPKNIRPINNYSDEKVFQKMAELPDEMYKSFSIDKEVMKNISPKNLDELAVVFALGSKNCSYGRSLYKEYFSEKKPFADDILLEDVLSETNGTVLFTRQINEILKKIMGNDIVARRITVMLRRIRHIATIDRSILRATNVSELLNLLRLSEYRQSVKVAYCTFKDRCAELDFTDEFADRIFLMLAKASVLTCKKSLAKSRATVFYKITSGLI